MTTRIQFLDRDAAVALSKAVNDTLEPEQTETADSFETSIARLRQQINDAREQLARTEAELDSIALGGPLVNKE